MPELPETETIARDLDGALRGARVARVAVARADVLREVAPRTLARRAVGARIERVHRRAKLVVLDLDRGDRIVVQPRFTGALLLDGGALPESAHRYAAVSLTFDDGRRLHYCDVRRLGTLALMSPARWATYHGALGPEPLDPGFTPMALSGLLRGRRQAVKRVLMDQRRLAGVGNIYATESLWRAGVDPSRAAGALSEHEAARLHAGLTSVLREAVAARGTSFRDYRDAFGGRGAFSARLDAYGRGGEPCHRCGATLVSTHAIDGRATVLCVRCQA